jgi:hypothetical protein
MLGARMLEPTLAYERNPCTIFLASFHNRLNKFTNFSSMSHMPASLSSF